MLAAVEKMPEDWNETELGWYLVRAAPGRTLAGAKITKGNDSGDDRSK